MKKRKVQFEDLLTQLRLADRDTWSLIAEEIRLIRPVRDVQAAWSFKIGQYVSLPHPEANRRINGKIIAIQKNCGQVLVAADIGEKKPKFISLPASALMGKAE